MLLSDMMPSKQLHPLRGEMFLQLQVPRISTLLKTPTKHISCRILTPHQMTFIRYIRPNIAENPHTIIWFQERSLQKVYPSAPKNPSKKYDGPVYVLAEVYKLLSAEAVVALEKYNSESMNRMAKKRGSHVTDVTDHELSIAESNISEEQTKPHQDVDAFEGEVDTILDYINSQHHQEEDINRKCSKRTFSRLLAVALRMYLTLHLPWFEQSM